MFESGLYLPLCSFASARVCMPEYVSDCVEERQRHTFGLMPTSGRYLWRIHCADGEQRGGEGRESERESERR